MREARTSRDGETGEKSTGVKYCLCGTRQLYDISEGHGRIPAKPLGISCSLAITFCFFLQCPVLPKIILRKNPQILIVLYIFLYIT